MAGVSPVTLCSSSGSASSAAKAIGQTGRCRGASARPAAPRGHAWSRATRAASLRPTRRRRRSPRRVPSFRLQHSERPASAQVTAHPSRALLPQHQARPAKGSDGRRFAGRSGPKLARGPRQAGTRRGDLMRRRPLVRHAPPGGGRDMAAGAGRHLPRPARPPEAATPQSTTLSGTPSAAAASLLQRAVPGQSGTPSRSCSRRTPGRWTDPAVREADHGHAGPGVAPARTSPA